MRKQGTSRAGLPNEQSVPSGPAGMKQPQHNLAWLLTEMLNPPELAEARDRWTKAAKAGHAGALDALEQHGDG